MTVRDFIDHLTCYPMDADIVVHRIYMDRIHEEKAMESYVINRIYDREIVGGCQVVLKIRDYDVK